MRAGMAAVPRTHPIRVAWVLHSGLDDPQMIEEDHLVEHVREERERCRAEEAIHEDGHCPAVRVLGAMKARVVDSKPIPELHGGARGRWGEQESDAHARTPVRHPIEGHLRVGYARRTFHA